MKYLLTFAFLVSVSFHSLTAAEHRVEVLKEAPPADELSKEVAEQLGTRGIRVIRGTSRTVCDLWFCESWEVSEKPSAGLLYPFQPGQLIGVARYPRDGSDFRDQDINEGVYTLRYALQPVDGAHIGTSPTRDFLLLVKAEDDKSAAPMEYEDLVIKSSEAAESTHPAMLSLQRITDKKAKTPSISHNEDHDWWIVRGQGTAIVDKKKSALPFKLVVVGVAAE